jgi:hypothetical protein
MFRMEPSNLEAERELLLDAAAYARWLQPRLKEKEAEKPIVDEFEEDLSVDPNRGY